MPDMETGDGLKAHAIGLHGSTDLDSVVSGDLGEQLRAPLLQPSRLGRQGSGQPQLEQQSGAIPPQTPPQTLEEQPLLPEEPHANGHEQEDASGQVVAKQGGSATWQWTSVIALGEMFGLGILTLPSDFARLGWAVAAGLIVVTAIGMVYSGQLFASLARRVPGATRFEDYAVAALGQRGRYLVYGTVYMAVLLDPVIFHLTAATSLQQVFWWRGGMPLWLAGILVAGIIWPLAQVREIEGVSAISLVGTLGMILAVGVALVKLLLLDRSPGPRAPVNEGQQATIAVIGFFDIIFCYGGAQNWTQYMSGMQRKTDFNKTIAVIGLFLPTMYLALGGVGYFKLGSDFDQSKPITSVLPTNAWTSVMNAGLFAHCIIAYQIDIWVWTEVFLGLTGLKAPGSRSSGARHRLLWLAVSTLGIAFSFTVSFLLPHFDTIMGLVAAIGDLSALLGLPALCAVLLLKPQLGPLQQVICYALIPLSAALSGLGVYSAIAKLAQQAR